MKIDLHVHSGISVCASTTYIEAVDLYAAKNEHFVLCNHYNALYTTPYAGYTQEEFPKRYVEEFYLAKEYGLKKGVKVFFGIETAISMPDCPYAEYLIYGATPKFLLENPLMYELDQKGLYELCKKNELLLVQAHPFRKEQGHFPHDMTLADGVEINCHYRFLREEERVRELAKKHNIIVTCGSDFHNATQHGNGGIICKDVNDEAELAAVIKNREFEIYIG